MPHRSARAELIADTALALLADRGMRGLTHRAVDEAAGMPLGSTSNPARTRAALLEAAVARLAGLESALLEQRRAAGPPGSREELADALAATLHRLVTHDRKYTTARFELALEATRRPELSAVYDSAARGFLEPLVALLAAEGSPEPERHARSLLAWMEGTVFLCVAGVSSHTPPPDPATLREDILALLRGMAGPARPPAPAGRP